MRTPQERFEDDYMAVEEAAHNKRGFRVRYVYYGPWYLWNETAETVCRNKRLFVLLCALNAAAYLPAALTASPVGRTIFVGLPASLAVAAFLFEALGAAQFCAAKERMPRPDYRDINAKLRLASRINALLLFAAAIAAAVLLAVNGFAGRELLIPTGYLLSGLCSWAVFARYNAMKIISFPNETATVEK